MNKLYTALKNPVVWLAIAAFVLANIASFNAGRLYEDAYLAKHATGAAKRVIEKAIKR